MNNNTAKNFALQLGSLIALYVSLTALIWLSFAVINILHPDATEGYGTYDSAQQAIRFGIALLVVFFPAYIVLTRMVNQVRRKETGTYMGLTKWLVYLSLLVGGLILLGDLVVVIMTYLNGEITLRFILKSGVMLAVIGLAFYYYIQDAKEYWNTHEKQSKQYGLGAILVVVIALVLGFTHSDTPAEVRDMKLDEVQVGNFYDLQYRIEDSYRVQGSLPSDIASLYIGIDVPTAPEGREAYQYKVIDEDTYELCAVFAYPSINNGREATMAIAGETAIAKNPYNNFDHGAGKTCFERTVVKDQTQIPTKFIE